MRLLATKSEREVGAEIRLVFRRLLVVVLAVGASNCSSEPGRVEIELTWGSAGPPTDAGAHLFGRVVEALEDEPHSGRRLLQAAALAEISPVPLSEASWLVFSRVPYGERRVVIIEIRQSRDRASDLLRYGLSRPFSLERGKVTRVPVALEVLRPPSGRVLGAQVDGKVAAADLVFDPTVVLLIASSEEGRRVIASNYQALLIDDHPLRIAQDLSVPISPGCVRRLEGDDACLFGVPWNLDLGLPQPCSEEDHCPRRVFLQLEDEIGQRSIPFSHDFIVDTRAPRVSTATVSYFPGPDNLLPVVSAAKAGSRVALHLELSEELTRLPSSFLVTFRSGARPPRVLAFDLVPSSVSFRSARYEVVVPDGFPSGEYADRTIPLECHVGPCGTFDTSISVTDLAGNHATLSSLPGVIIRFETIPPMLRIDQNRVSYIRSPIGSGADVILGTFTVPRGPYFALAPENGLADPADLPAGTFELVGGKEPTAIRVWADPGRTALLSRTIRPRANHGWSRADLQLSPADAPAVYVSGLDDAGNESPAVRIDNAWYISTSASPVYGESPHEVSVSGHPTAPGEARMPLDDRRLVSSVDGEVLNARAQFGWTQRLFRAPPAGPDYVMAYDAFRDRVVALGDETWEWDGRSWSERPSATDPPPRWGEAMVYDGARGRVILFGGCCNEELNLNDMWAWTGARWLRVQPTSGSVPPTRHEHAMAYDSARRRVVLFGGFVESYLGNDTWEWDGAQWHRAHPRISPEPRRHHGMAYDPIREVTVLFGGDGYAEDDFSDTWEWDGEEWVHITTEPSRTPSRRRRHALFYDGGRTILFGGVQGNETTEIIDLDDTWSWDGLGWSPVHSPSEGPPPASDRAVAYDSRQAQVLLFGGYREAGGGLNETWTWTGNTWLRAAPAPGGPAPREGHAAAYDGGRDRVIVFGGVDSRDWVGYGDTWEWAGRSWVQNASSAGPGRRVDHALAADWTRSSVLLFGGWGGSSLHADTWLLSEGHWSLMNTSISPSARQKHSLVEDPRGRRVILHGGRNDSEALSDTWSFNGVDWSRLPTLPGSGPGARWSAAAAFDEREEVVLLFGGDAVDGPRSDTWKLIDRTWTQVFTDPSRTPAPRARAHMAYDPVRGRVLLFGGAARFAWLNDLWEWDGAGWDPLETEDVRTPPVRDNTALAFDRARGEALLFGGRRAESTDETWILSRPDRSSIQFVATLPSDVAVERVRGIDVMAHCGADFLTSSGSPASGAELWAFSTHPAPGFVWIATSPSGARAASFATARSFSTEREIFPLIVQGSDGRSRMYLQVRPAGDGRAGIASVSLDYIEVRFRYDTE